MKKILLFLSVTLLIACHSKIYDWTTVSETRPTALIFLSTECPVSKKYIPTINRLKAAYPQVQFVGVFSDRESRQEVQQFCRDNQVQFSTAKDAGNALVRRWGATHTPQAFLLSTQAQVLYDGAIDNWYYDLEQLHREPTDHFLRNAIESLLQQRPVFVRDTRPVGCRIEQ
jgi:thiol-disulfide isomerase/thioredoxin